MWVSEEALLLGWHQDELGSLTPLLLVELAVVDKFPWWKLAVGRGQRPVDLCGGGVFAAYILSRGHHNGGRLGRCHSIRHTLAGAHKLERLRLLKDPGEWAGN